MKGPDASLARDREFGRLQTSLHVQPASAQSWTTRFLFIIREVKCINEAASESSMMGSKTFKLTLLLRSVQ